MLSGAQQARQGSRHESIESAVLMLVRFRSTPDTAAAMLRILQDNGEQVPSPPGMRHWNKLPPPLPSLS